MKVLLILSLIATVSMAAPVGSLIDDFKDFLKLIPVDQIKAIAKDHLANDAEFGDVVRYLQGPDWAALVATVNSKQEFIDFKDYMKKAGLDLDLIFGVIDAYVKSLHPGTTPGHDESLRSFLDAVEKIIPKDKLLALLEDKMENSTYFQAFYKQISSQEAKKLVEEVRAIPEVQQIAKKLTDMGVRVEETLEAIYAFLGWGKP